MNRRGIPGLADGLPVIGLALSVIGLSILTVTLPDPAAIAESLTSGRITSPVASAPPTTPLFGPGDHGAPVTVAADPLLAFPAPPSSSLVDRDTRRRQGDTRLYLRDAAAAARRYPWAGPWPRETRTDLWINAPGSIGSTSPPEASPIDLRSRSHGQFR